MPLHPFIPLPNGVQVIIKGDLLGQTTEEVHYVVLPSAPGPADVQGVAEDFDTWFETDVIPILSNEYTLISVTATDWTTSTGSQFVVVPPTAVHGGVVSPAVANTLAVVISQKTALRGRSYQGRTYLAAIGQNGTSDANTLTSGAQASIDAAYIEIPGYNVTTPYALVIASFYSGVDSLHKPIPRTTGVGTPVSSIVVQFVLGNQRRRRPGRGI